MSSPLPLARLSRQDAPGRTIGQACTARDQVGVDPHTPDARTGDGDDWIERLYVDLGGEA